QKIGRTKRKCRSASGPLRTLSFGLSPPITAALAAAGFHYPIGQNLRLMLGGVGVANAHHSPFGSMRIRIFHLHRAHVAIPVGGVWSDFRAGLEFGEEHSAGAHVRG
ncbi:MAG: hypothetical protein J0H37_01450, partial [Hyphomicrobium denitrificans]|nr:hypothetical protein [Hyphomicrobium denitrificans]